MSAYLLRVLAHKLREGRGLFLLTVFGVALGVASVLCIQILNLNSIGAFAGALKAVSGQADLSVLPRAATMDEELFPVALGTEGVAAAWPLVNVDVALEGREDWFLELVGVDVYSHTGIPWEETGEGGADALARAQSVPGWVAVTPQLATRLGWSRGTRFEVSSGSRRFRLEVGGLADFEKVSPTAGTKLAVMDIAQAQELLGLAGRLSQIDVRLAEGADRGATAERLRARLGPGVEVLTPANRAQRTDGLLAAFRLNLTALSLISLVVGFFLIFSATQASLVRRRREFGLLRALGADRGQVLRLMLAEVALLGILGVLLGLPLGYLAAAGNLDVVSRSLSNLYLLQETEVLMLPAWLLPLAGLVGLTGALVGGAGPALEMARREPTELMAAYTLHERSALRAGPLFLAGLALMAAAAAWYQLHGAGWKWAGFALAIALCLALPLLTPLVVQGLTGRIRPRSFGMAYAARTLSTQLQTTSYAVSALAIAVSMMVGITVMIDSFRRTVQVWVDSTIQADVYITSRSWRRAGADATLEEEIVEKLRRFPGVRGMDRLRRFFAELEGRRVLVNGIELGLEVAASRTPLLAGPPDAAKRAMEPGTCVISEPLMRKFGVGVGDSITMPGPAGPVTLRIVGVYYDYTTDLGEVTVHLANIEPLAGPGPINSLSLYLEPGRSPERVVDEVKAAFPGVPLWVRSNRALRAEVFKIFDQTFAVTRILQLMALVVAACSIALTLLVLARERTRELALYAALGATPGQVFRVFLGKGLAIGGVGLVVGMAGGLTLALILIHVINLDWFGWTIQAHWPGTVLAEQSLTILLAAAAASLYPAWRAARTPASELTREDL